MLREKSTHVALHQNYKYIWAANDTIEKVKIKSTEWEKIYGIANHTSDKGLVSRIYF